LGQAAHGASIRMLGPEVILQGEIVASDGVQFERVTRGLPNYTRVVLESPGGDLEAGLRIARAVRAQGFHTVVQQHCASMCGLIWLAGSTRWLSYNAQIGFHAIRALDGSVHSAGNALVGSYLRDLGFDDRAIVWFTKAPPSGMAWWRPDQVKLAFKYLDGFVPYEEPSLPVKQGTHWCVQKFSWGSDTHWC